MHVCYLAYLRHHAELVQTYAMGTSHIPESTLDTSVIATDRVGHFLIPSLRGRFFEFLLTAGEQANTTHVINKETNK